ncbi:MAG: sulfatase-like hydrolase/transferase [Planctomycetota bacterium]|nr:sulfatase-like hydrolase/transferase [Planctomycetota bacterium]MDP7254640.1 sulfatase-like hydrolase/transferase [Planctomycetota bacterium]
MSKPKSPNILIVMPDQMRGDCLSLERHPAVMTPNIDSLGGSGAHFTRAYSTCPSCIPARRAMMTGQFPETNGVVGYKDGIPIESKTMPQYLADAGYATAITGRTMHQSPADEPYGFEQRRLGSTYIQDDEYARMLDEAVPELGGIRGIGCAFNGWQAKPWPLDEYLHPTNWTVQQSRKVIAEHDDDRPLFLINSFYAPHPPLIPPSFYMERYLRMDLPSPAIGDWASPPPNDGIGMGVESARVHLRGEALLSAQAGYFGLINHIDDQMTWLLPEFRNLSRRNGRPWLILLTSDHGEMLGDHYYFRKCEPYEGSARVPFLIQGSPELEFSRGLHCSQPVCLEDILPTLLDSAGIDIPDDIDGQSLLPVLRGDEVEIRPQLHCEHSRCYSIEQAFQSLTDGHMKYIWRTHTGYEELFDIDNDPSELTNLATDTSHSEELARWQGLLADRLKQRSLQPPGDSTVRRQ